MIFLRLLETCIRDIQQNTLSYALSFIQFDNQLFHSQLFRRQTMFSGVLKVVKIQALAPTCSFLNMFSQLRMFIKRKDADVLNSSRSLRKFGTVFGHGEQRASEAINKMKKDLQHRSLCMQCCEEERKGSLDFKQNGVVFKFRACRRNAFNDMWKSEKHVINEHLLWKN